MISLRSVSRRVSTDWRGPLLIGDAGLDDRVTKPIDFYEYARKISVAGADVLLTSPSRGTWQVSRHRFGRIVVQSGTAGGGIILGGTSQAESFVVYLRDPDYDASLRLNGKVIAANDVAVLPPGRQFALVCCEAHRWISVSVPLAALEATGASRTRLDLLGAGATLIPMRGATRQFSAVVMDALDVGQGPLQASLQRSAEIEQSVLRELSAVIGAGDVSSYAARCGTSRLDRINRDALAFIRRQDGLDSHVEDLCRAIDVAERSVLRAFHKFFGMGPTQYMKLRRLNRVHCELQARDCKETTVTGVMTRCGVTELGRFAGVYRELFGESPSETLKRRRETVA